MNSNFLLYASVANKELRLSLCGYVCTNLFDPPPPRVWFGQVLPSLIFSSLLKLLYSVYTIKQTSSIY